ncbi:MAG: hypothetical protein ACO1QB_18575 [Verrucomicrobiales bacterium]
MKLSTLAILIGLVYAIPQIWALANPVAFSKAARKFPRSEPWGFALMGLATVWFLYNVNAETIADFAAYKKLMLIGFGAIGFGACIFVRDFLAVRGLAVFMLLLAWFTLNFTRPAESEWRLVLVTWAYLWVIVGMWLTISPWRFRDYLNWTTATPGRLRATSGIRLALGLLVAALGFTVFK